MDMGNIAIGTRVRIAVQGHARSGEVIRAYRVLAPGMSWPCFEDSGILWPLNPEWLELTSAHISSDAEQLPLFA